MKQKFNSLARGKIDLNFGLCPQMNNVKIIGPIRTGDVWNTAPLYNIPILFQIRPATTYSKISFTLISVTNKAILWNCTV